MKPETEPTWDELRALDERLSEVIVALREAMVTREPSGVQWERWRALEGYTLPEWRERQEHL